MRPPIIPRMETPIEIHRRATALAEEALSAHAAGQKARSRELFEDAYALEARAAWLFAPRLQLEPMRSILLGSAAHLALCCNRPNEAKHLIDVALEGQPPTSIADELRQMQADIVSETTTH